MHHALPAFPSWSPVEEAGGEAQGGSTSPVGVGVQRLLGRTAPRGHPPLPPFSFDLLGPVMATHKLTAVAAFVALSSVAAAAPSRHLVACATLCNGATAATAQTACVLDDGQRGQCADWAAAAAPVGGGMHASLDANGDGVLATPVNKAMDMRAWGVVPSRPRPVDLAPPVNGPSAEDQLAGDMPSDFPAIDSSMTAEDALPDKSPVEETPVEEAPVEETPVEETPVEETPVEETPVEETPFEDAPVDFPAGDAPADETPVQETPVEETPVEETPVAETPVEETPVEETPVEDTPVDDVRADETPVEETPVEETPVEETPAEDTPADDAPADETSVEDAPVIDTPVEMPVEETPVEETPVEETPVEETPVAETPEEEAPVEGTPVEETPVEETPVEETPAGDASAVETPVEETPVEGTPSDIAADDPPADDPPRDAAAVGATAATPPRPSSWAAARPRPVGRLAAFAVRIRTTASAVRIRDALSAALRTVVTAATTAGGTAAPAPLPTRGGVDCGQMDAAFVAPCCAIPAYAAVSPVCATRPKVAA